MPTVFVYGTLKTGYGNHRALELPDGEPAVANGIDIFASAMRSYPFAARGTGRTIGEVLHVSEEQFRRIDRLESYPSFYQREEIIVELASGETVKAWIYLCPKMAATQPKIESGEWLGRSSLLSKQTTSNNYFNQLQESV